MPALKVIILAQQYVCDMRNLNKVNVLGIEWKNKLMYYLGHGLNIVRCLGNALMRKVSEPFAKSIARKIPRNTAVFRKIHGRSHQSSQIV